jgi:hypothetical protein
MLTDPLIIGVVAETAYGTIVTDIDGNTGVTRHLTFRLVDAGPGSSKRQVTDGNDKLLLTINHSLSSENKPFQTNRSVIRLDRSRVNAETGKVVTQSAYLVCATPYGVDFSDADAAELARTLIMFALTGPTNGSNWTNAAGQPLPRVLAGEP